MKRYFVILILAICSLLCACSVAEENKTEATTTNAEIEMTTTFETEKSIPSEEVTTCEAEEITTAKEETKTSDTKEASTEPLTEADIELDGIPYEELTPEQIVELDYMYWNSQDGKRLEVIETNANIDSTIWNCTKELLSTAPYEPLPLELETSHDDDILAYIAVQTKFLYEDGFVFEETIYYRLKKIDGYWKILGAGTSP